MWKHFKCINCSALRPTNLKNWSSLSVHYTLQQLMLKHVQYFSTGNLQDGKCDIRAGFHIRSINIQTWFTEFNPSAGTLRSCQVPLICWSPLSSLLRTTSRLLHIDTYTYNTMYFSLLPENWSELNWTVYSGDDGACCWSQEFGTSVNLTIVYCFCYNALYAYIYQ